MRFMMQKGYSLYLLHDINQCSVRLNTGQWAVIKNPIPEDKKSGFKLYETYDEAYQAALKFTWKDEEFSPTGKIEDLGKAVRRKKTRDDT